MKTKAGRGIAHTGKPMNVETIVIGASVMLPICIWHSSMLISLRCIFCPAHLFSESTFTFPE